MKVNIGMIIWKEMKNQGFSQSRFMQILRDRGVFLRDVFKMETIDVYSLIQISDVLKINFFQSYEAEELPALLKSDEKENPGIAYLHAVIKEQQQLLLTHKKMIRQQDHLIAQLQKNEWH